MTAKNPGPPSAGLDRAQAQVDHIGTADAGSLAAALDDICSAPGDRGRLEMVVRRPAVDRREVVGEGVLDVVWGLVGDSWSKRRRSVGEGDPEPARQVTVMSYRVARVLAERPEAMAEAGDQLYVDFDLSEDNLPAGARLVVGEAVLEVSAEPHLGCSKFARRFGRDALAFVNSPEGRRLRLRGLNARVVHGATVRVGDPVAVVSRPAPLDLRP